MRTTGGRGGWCGWRLSAEWTEGHSVEEEPHAERGGTRGGRGERREVRGEGKETRRTCSFPAR